jgi:hypothetical protein
MTTTASSGSSTTRRTSPALVPVALTVVVGLLVGIGVTFLALRDDGGEDGVAFDSGPPSVDRFDLPSPSTGEALTGQDILERARAQQQAPIGAAPATEPATARAALDAFLAAEADDRSVDAFALLDPDAQRRVGSPVAWRQAAAERPAPTRRATVTAERRTAPPPSETVEITVRIERTPEITPFRGLVPAEATEVWTIRRQEGTGWRVVDGRPSSSEPVLPADAAAVEAARRWVDAASRCGDGTDATGALQLTGPLLGQAALAPLVCERAAEGAAWTTAASAVRLADLPDVTAFVAAFGPGVGRWARGVEVTSGNERFTVVLGPLGREWRVMGLSSAPPA